MKTVRWTSLCMMLCISIWMNAGIVAYFTDGDTVVNPLNVSLSDVEIDEDFQPPKEPTGSFVKKVRLYNSGNCKSFVRLKVVVSNSDIGNYIHLNVDLISQDAKGGMWKDGGDGFYYYTRPLDVGEYTSYLFQEVSVGIGVPDCYELDIIVYGESYQADENRFFNKDAGVWDYEQAWELYLKNVK